MWDVAAFSVFSQSAREAREEDSNFVTVVANTTTDGLLVYCRFLAFFQLNLKNNLSYSAAAAVWWYPNIIHNTTKNNKYRLTDQVYIFVSPQNKVLMPLFTTTKTTTLHLTISINAPLQPLLHDLTDVCIDTPRRRNIFWIFPEIFCFSSSNNYFCVSNDWLWLVCWWVFRNCYRLNCKIIDVLLKIIWKLRRA